MHQQIKPSCKNYILHFRRFLHHRVRFWTFGSEPDWLCDSEHLGLLVGQFRKSNPRYLISARHFHLRTNPSVYLFRTEEYILNAGLLLIIYSLQCAGKVYLSLLGHFIQLFKVGFLYTNRKSSHNGMQAFPVARHGSC